MFTKLSIGLLLILCWTFVVFTPDFQLVVYVIAGWQVGAWIRNVVDLVYDRYFAKPNETN